MNLCSDLTVDPTIELDCSLIVDNISNTTIKNSDIHGSGLFATDDIEKGSVLCLLDGQIVSWDSYKKVSSTNHFCQFDDYLFMEWNALDYDVLMIRPFRTKYSFINHSRSPNTILNRYPLAVLTLRKIYTGEELTLDYRKEPLNKEYVAAATYL